MTEVYNILNQYDLKICSNEEVKQENEIDLVNEPMMFYKMTVEKQDVLGKWINKDFIELKTIYKDKTIIEQNAYWMIFQ